MILPPPNIVCITGNNGSGKTKILEHIAKSNNNSSIFSTTISNNNKVLKTGNSNELKTIQQVENVDEFIAFLLPIYKYKKVQLKNALFSPYSLEYKEYVEKDNINIPKRDIVIDKICKNIQSISNESIANEFLNCFGFPTQNDIDNAYKDLYKNDCRNRHTGSQQFQYSKKLQKGLTDWIEENQENQDFKDNFKNKIQDIIINNLNYKKINKFENFNDFTNKLSKEVFNTIDINNLIQELGSNILQDYKEKNNKKNATTQWKQINEELESQKDNFPFILVKPDVNLSEYDLEFEYKADYSLEKKGQITFDMLSTGEKNIFTLLVYKYILINNNDEKMEYKYLLLDEFDANLNPKLINFYINILKEIAKKNSDIKIIFTTHSSLTLKSLYKDGFDKNIKLYSLQKDIKNKKHSLNEITQNNFDNFLKDYSDDLIHRETEIITDEEAFKKAKYVIICEGKGDKTYIESYLDKQKSNKDDYYISVATAGTKPGGHSLIKEKLICLDNYYTKKDLENKKFILLYDYDEAYESFKLLKKGTLDIKTFLLTSCELINFNLNSIKKIIAIIYKPINEEDFLSQNKNIEYPYSDDINDVFDKKNVKKGFCIEDLIVSYNINLYTEYLKNNNNNKELNIQNFFSIEKIPSHKKTIEKFFNEKQDQLNFKGFDNLFKIINDEEVFN